MRLTARRVLAAPRIAWALGAFLLVLANPSLRAQSAPLRLGVVGLVHGHASGFLQDALKRSDVDIVGIVESDTAVADEYRARFNLDQRKIYRSLVALLERQHPEAVAVFTNTFDHRAVVQACSRRKVHVMMEKPLAVSLEHARAIAGAAREGNIHVLVNFETTWYPNTGHIHRIVHQSGWGEIRKMVAHDGHRGPKEIGVGPEFLSWLTDPDLNGGGALTDFGCYGANLFTWLMDNQRPTSVTAVTQQIKPQIYPRVDDEATIVLTYPRAQGIVQASWNWPSNRKDLEVYGTTASVVSVGRDRARLRTGDHPEEEVTSPPPDSFQDDPISYLKAVVHGHLRPAGPSSLENNLIVSEVLDAARRSAVTGRTVLLPVSGTPPGE